MSSHILSSQEDKNLVYNVYPINKLRQSGLEGRRTKPNFSPNNLDSVQIDDRAHTTATTTTTTTTKKEDLQKLKTTTIKRTEIENFESFGNFETSYPDPSEESAIAMITPCQGLRMMKTETTKKQNFSSNTSTPKGGGGGGGVGGGSAADALKTELSHYKKELNDYNNATKELEQKYMKINVELGELQQINERFIANRSADKNSESTDSCRDGSEFSLKRKYTQIFHRGQNSFGLFSVKENSNDNKTDKFLKDISDHTDNEPLGVNILRNKQQQQQQKKSTVEFRFTQQQQQQQQPQHEEPSQSSSLKSCLSNPKRRSNNNSTDDLQLESNSKGDGGSDQVYDIYTALLQAMGTQHHHHHNNNNNKNNKSNNNDIKTLTPIKSPISCFSEKSLNCDNENFVDQNDLEKIIANLQNDQDHYRNVILEQQNVLQDYQIRCQKAKQIMESQQNEIEKLTINNQDLHNEVNIGIDQLRLKVDAKLKKVGPLTEKLHQEQLRNQKITKENNILKEHKRALQNQIKELKLKLDDLIKKKAIIFERLKNTERDLRVFRNYNAALKQEKTKNSDEIYRLKEKLENLQTTHKRSIIRQRELNEKNCRDLQKRVHDLEQKLGRSNNSTSNIVIERDRLISELQSQINTLVHNFEVSQKHIRILRRHIHNAAGENSNQVATTNPLVLKRKSFV